jgi:lipid II:glycine glycyltransferase (peptidoglycan interpeptide bridge formation enzyme)
MLEIKRKKYGFELVQVWFAKAPFEIKNTAQAIFKDCKGQGEGFSCSEFATLTIDLRMGLNEIWRGMDGSSTRYSINRAEREGVKIRINENFEEFKKIEDDFRKLKSLPPVAGLDDYQKFTVLFTAEYKGKVIGGNLFIFDEKNFRWLLGASRRLKPGEDKIIIGCANRLLIWEAIKYAKARGIEEFDFGGYYTGREKDEEKERISAFKKSFGGKLTIHYECKKNYSKIYQFLYSIKNLIK